MRRFTAWGLSLFLLGAATMVLAASLGQVQVYMLLLLPIFVLKGPVGIISVLLLISGAALLLFGRSIEKDHRPSLGRAHIDDNRADRTHYGRRPRADVGGIIFLGPVPIVLGSKVFKKRLPDWWSLFLIGSFISLLLILLSVAFLIVGIGPFQ